MARLGTASSLDPSARLACLALISSASLLATERFSAAVACIASLLLLIEGLSALTILRESAFVAVFVTFTALIRLLGVSSTGTSWIAALISIGAYGIRLLAAFLVCRLFYASTRISELRDAATRITRRIPVLRRFDIGLILSMVLGFIPQIFDEWSASLEAVRSRGMPRHPGISKQALFIGSFLRRLMLRAATTPEALSARGWTRDRGIAPLTWRFRDSLCLFFSACIFVAASLRLV